MKKIYSVLTIFAAIMGLASCEDVPQPYNTPTPDGKKDTTTVKTNDYINETFSSNFGSFTAKTVKGTPWVIDFKTAKATGYNGTTKETIASDAYLVSQPVDLTKSTGAYLQFDYILRYVRQGTTNQVLITDNYTGDAATTNWTDITGTLVEGSDWVTFSTYKKNIPSQFIGKNNIVIAIRYACTTTSSTWEVKNLKLAEGKVQEDTPTPTPTTGDYLNETFATGFGVFTAKTVKGTPWIIDFKTAKATGYDNAAQKTTESDAYIISPAIDLSNSKGATLQFEYILRYYTRDGKVVTGVADEVLITDEYDGDPSSPRWEDITGKLTEGSDWTTFSTYKMDIPSGYLGVKTVYIALHYTCKNSSSTWEVKNLTLKEKE